MTIRFMQLRLEEWKSDASLLYCDPTVIKEPSPSNKLKRGAHSLYQIRLVITYIKKIRRVWLVENECIFRVTRAQITNSADKISSVWTFVMCFSGKLLTSNNRISCATWSNLALINFFKHDKSHLKSCCYLYLCISNTFILGRSRARECQNERGFEIR